MLVSIRGRPSTGHARVVEQVAKEIAGAGRESQTAIALAMATARMVRRVKRKVF